VLVPAAALARHGHRRRRAARLVTLPVESRLEFDYLENEAERRWFRRVIEQEELRRQLAR
jgi:hypothetical protein